MIERCETSHAARTGRCAIWLDGETVCDRPYGHYPATMHIGHAPSGQRGYDGRWGWTEYMEKDGNLVESGTNMRPHPYAPLVDPQAPRSRLMVDPDNRNHGQLVSSPHRAIEMVKYGDARRPIDNNPNPYGEPLPITHYRLDARTVTVGKRRFRVWAREAEDLTDAVLALIDADPRDVRAVEEQ